MLWRVFAHSSCACSKYNTDCIPQLLNGHVHRHFPNSQTHFNEKKTLTTFVKRVLKFNQVTEQQKFPHGDWKNIE